MDEFYPFEAAATALSLEFQDAMQPEVKNKQLGNLFENKARPIVVIGHNPSCWRLVNAPKDDDEPEEIVARIQGILASKDLPPVTRRLSSSKCRYIRQGVTLIGPNSEIFQQARNSIVRAQEMFSRHFKDGKLDLWEPTVLFDEVGITCSNRYFQHRGDTLPEDIVAFDDNVDPNHTLATAAADDFLHTIHNRVEYFERIENAHQSRSYVASGPALFRVGDIVEAQVSLVVFPTKENGGCFRLILRSLALLDGTHTQAACIKRMQQGVRLPMFRTSLKRKVGYSVDGEPKESKKATGEMEVTSGTKE